MPIPVILDDDVALVLFELLASEQIETRIPDLEAPERNALSALQGHLEKALLQPFSPEYDRLLESARQSLLRRFGP
jgi:hypothetical protein